MDNQNKKRNLFSDILDYAELFVVAVCVVIVLFSGIVRVCTVDGASMNKTLTDGDVLLVSDTLYTPERGDIVVFHQIDRLQPDNSKPLVKRVIGVGGDTVTVNYDTWELSITDKNGNTTQFDEDYKFIDPQRPSAFSGVHTYKVPEGKLFVLGDNRNNSYDSRYQSVGYVDERQVLGRVILRTAPLSNFGTVD